MTEDEARAWIADRFGEEAFGRVAEFVAAVVDESTRQNLISSASIDAIWTRHVVDSAQLLDLASPNWSHWIDIGTGGGFPGMIVALLAPDRRVTMVEPRKRRVEFLENNVRRLALPLARVVGSKVEQLREQADVISARAVASVENLLRGASQCATGQTLWLLPRGRSGTDGDAPFHMMFHVEHSLTDKESTILVLRGLPR